jgi:hypothetical protein
VSVPSGEVEATAVAGGSVARAREAVVRHGLSRMLVASCAEEGLGKQRMDCPNEWDYDGG